MKAILILAHPGHELRIFHRMERARPAISILTDGSGGSQLSRIAYSRASIAAAGATPGPVFAPMPDRGWYQAILAGDSTPFRRAADDIAGAAAGAAAVTIVADAVDGYNPVHDLASAVGAGVADRLAASGVTVTRLASAAVPGVAAQVAQELRLDDAARQRKMAAVEAYLPLAEEAQRIFQEDPELFGHEILLEESFTWPADFRPYWEEFAKGRVQSGRYANPITYADHVRPIALALLDRR